MSFDLSKFRNEFLQSDGWKVSDCYKPYEDKFLRKDVQDAYEGAKWGFEAGAASQQQEVDKLQCDIDKLQAELEVLQGMYNAVSLTAGELIDERDALQKRIDEALDHTINHGDYDNLTHIINILKGKV